jgi:hypothetical protein
VSLTPFGRVADLEADSAGILISSETPVRGEPERARAICQAHAEGLKVFLVPHLWVETGRGAEIDPDDAAWARWTDAY